MAAKKKSDKAVRPAAKDLRDMSAEDLRKALAEQRQELMSARFKHAAAQLEKTSELKAMRRQVARIETVLNEKEQRA
ncbi:MULTISPECIES: 50S ribosomal protein L29 [unclassified Desulfovibrio]|uniref:50S ribosomal protein L29 n=1 Tax=unclassified Desulfovibrio TaxID=2593640 RepID=UPI000F5DE5B2|nr:MULTISPECIES: 50S ribosomal protein L29 [unclassified Desulfovibrio]RRD69713.1 50S ribosomal protein L29 [Desulfovibrio sp. OH1209_COT-279]RRD86346.1 50S ribosomal protein L29 [Desulfovibrio sp. OH1186_COT-070]